MCLSWRPLRSEPKTWIQELLFNPATSSSVTSYADYLVEDNTDPSEKVKIYVRGGVREWPIWLWGCRYPCANGPQSGGGNVLMDST